MTSVSRYISYREAPVSLHPYTPVAYFTKKVNPNLAKLPLKSNGNSAKYGLTSKVEKSATDTYLSTGHLQLP